MGIFFGIIGALCQSIAYIFSKSCLSNDKMKPLHFLMLSHLIIAFFALITLIFLSGAVLPDDYNWVLWAVCGGWSYLAGQLALISALRMCDASRVSALLGLKVPMLAFISFFVMQNHFHIVQWLAVGMILLTALFLARSGGKLSSQSLLWIFLATSGYSFSDICATNLVKTFDFMGKVHAPLFSVCMVYLCCGIITVGYFFIKGFPNLNETKKVTPYSVVWFSSFIFLFASFSSVGFVAGNIAQSSRGIISITLGMIIASLGMNQFEENISKKLFFKRLSAGCVMLSSIAAFSLIE